MKDSLLKEPLPLPMHWVCEVSGPHVLVTVIVSVSPGAGVGVGPGAGVGLQLPMKPVNPHPGVGFGAGTGFGSGLGGPPVGVGVVGMVVVGPVPVAIFVQFHLLSVGNPYGSVGLSSDASGARNGNVLWGWGKVERKSALN